jgi:HEAT repeat protein
MFKTRYSITPTIIAAAAAVLALASLAFAQDRDAAAREKERELIAIIKSDKPAADKAIPCKHLAIYGSKEAVPALAALLPDKDLSSWARIALEAITDPAADEALRSALDKVQGRELVGVMNSIGRRHRDGKAIAPLAKRLGDSDEQVVAAAAVAIGQIGGDEARKVLEQSLASGSAAAKSAVAEGAIFCAERYLADGNAGAAAKLYDAVRTADVAKQRQVEAARGAILARQSDGIPLLVEQLRSDDKDMLAIALRTAREMKGEQVTQALITEIPKAAPDRQDLVILALGDRNDRKAAPVLLETAKSGPHNARLAALSVLEHLGDASAIPVVLGVAAGEDKELAAAAKATLARMGGEDVDSKLFSSLQQSSGRMRRVLIELVEQRRLEGALPLFVKYAEDEDAEVRATALDAIGTIGGEEQIADLVKVLQKTEDRTQRQNIERALVTISRRAGAAAAKPLIALANTRNASDRVVAIRTLAAAGGAEALATVKAAVTATEPAVQNEAVATLSNWPSRWPDDAAIVPPLLSLAKSAEKPEHRILAARGYIEYVRGSKKLSPSDKIARLNDILPQLTRPDEKRLAISVLGGIPSTESLNRLATLTAEPELTEDAANAIVNLSRGRNAQQLPREARQKALQAVLDKSKDQPTRQRAEETLKSIR